MFFQTYGKNEAINITRGQVTYHRDPVPIKNLRKVDGSMAQPIATAIIMLMKAHDTARLTIIWLLRTAPPPCRRTRFSRRYFAIPRANAALYANATLT